MKNKKRLLLVGLMVFLVCLSTGELEAQVSLEAHQLPKNYALPSPEAAGITKVADIPVDLSTGQASISIPLYTVNTGKLMLPITLDYDASGIRVEQEATAVGLGWTLNAGGAITRSIRDKDDYLASDKYEDIGGPSWTGAAPTDGTMANYDIAYKAATVNASDVAPDLFCIIIRAVMVVW